MSLLSIIKEKKKQKYVIAVKKPLPLLGRWGLEPSPQTNHIPRSIPCCAFFFKLGSCCTDGGATSETQACHKAGPFLAGLTSSFV
jgi:hypothetical protein